MLHKDTTILLVEDDEVDAEAVLRAFKKAKIENPIMIAQDGVEALEIVFRELLIIRLLISAVAL